MEKQSLYIYKLDAQGNKVKFPNDTMPAKLGEYTYTAQRMAGTPTLTATLNYPTCLDEEWSGEEFVEFRGERYYVGQVPTSSKDNKSIMYKHELQFVSERIVLENVYFMDVVTAGADTYHSNSTTVKFMGDINEFVGRLNSSMTKSGIGYSVIIDEDITSESKLVSLDNVYLAEALQSIYTIYELPYYFVGKVCHVGYTENVISTPFEYRKGFVSIKKTNANYKIVNRVTGVGSSDNIPFYYPNDDATGTIERSQNLMPSIYRETGGAERFYNALNNTYKIPGTNDYYTFKNLYSKKKVKEIKVDFSDIKPTIEGVTNASGQLFGEIADVAFDQNDSDELGTGSGNNVFNGTDEYVHSYFYIKLHVYNGDYGFNLFEQGLEGGTAVLNMTTGNCAACEFEIGVTYKDSEPDKAFNPVLVDANGNLPAGDFEQKVTSQTSQYVERQQDTSANEVWIAVKKDNTSFGVVMPNATNNYRPSIGDKFVITGIKMPKQYVIAAEDRLEEALIKYMSENNDEKFTFSVSFSRTFLAENSQLAGILNENARIYIKYNDKEYFMYVNSYTCKADSNCLYDISVELTDKLSANVSALRSTITEIAGDIIGSKIGSSSGVSDIFGRMSRYFLSKINPDTANGLITFLKGLNVGKFVTGFIGGSGASIWFDSNGKTVVEADKAMFREELIVPQITFNCIDVISGDKANSFAYGRIKTVDTENRIATLDLLDDQWGTLHVSDICRGILHNIAGSNHTQDEYGANGFMEYSGYATSYFTPTQIIESEAGSMKFEYALQAGTSVHPLPGMNFFAYGNFVDKDRQAITYENRYYTRRLVNVNTWVIDPDVNIAYQNGDLSGLTINGQQMSGYSSFQDNVFIRGTIERLKPSGEVAMDLSYEGVWESGREYLYYDSVTYNGSTWACLNKEGSSAEPGTNSDWQEIASKGEDGSSVSNLGNWKTGTHVPYMGIVRMGRGSYQCITENGTDNPPLWCWTDNDSNRLIYNDGGYCLTGEVNTTDYVLVAEDGTDGTDGTSVNAVDVLYAISDSNSVAPTSGWQTTSPEWENGKYIWTKTIVDYGDGTATETDPVCISGGKGIKTIVEYYYRSTSNTTQTGGSWVTSYPGWQNGTYIWTKSLITYTDGTTEETLPACVTGSKGEGYTQMGRFYTGMVVPKMGVVSMGGGSYVAKASTTNPPLWCWTDNAGNRLTFNDGGYCLTGEVNTSEYDVWAEKGEPGKDGVDGKPGEDGIQGIQGCIMRDSEWKSGVTYRNDESLTGGTRYVDIAMVENNSATDGWDVYKCIKTHTSSSSITYTNTTYWTKLSGVGPIYTSLIIAKNASIKFVQGNELLIKDSNNNVVAGLTGGSSDVAGTTPIRIWAGGGVPGSAPFRVDNEGNMTATKANITGTITATGGTIGGFTVSSSQLKAVSGYDSMLLTSSLIRFMGEYSNVFIGAETMPASGGGSFSTPIRIEVDRTITSMAYGNSGMYISVEGSQAYDDTNYQSTGNHALYIPKGDICGFRLRTRRVSASQALSVMDSVILCINTSDITLTLPTGAEDGQIYYIRKMRAGNITLSGTILEGWGNTVNSINIKNSALHVIIYDKVNNLWTTNYMNN